MHHQVSNHSHLSHLSQLFVTLNPISRKEGKILKTMTKEIAKSEEKTELNKLSPAGINLLALENMMNKFLGPFIQQAEQNNQLMILLRQLMEQKTGNAHPASAGQLHLNPEPIPYTAMDIPEISFAKLKAIAPLLQSVFSSRRRNDALHTMIILLHTIHHLNGKAYADQLFGFLGISTANGYRLLGTLRRAYVLKMYRGEIMITDLGRKIYEAACTADDIRTYRHAIVHPYILH